MNAFIFVSYSRNDVKLITPIVRLLRLTIAGVPSVNGKSWEFVFQDIDNLEPGQEWQKQIDEAILQAEKIFVFWCRHAMQSSQVQREYTLALAHNKIVVPILLDDTPLSVALQGIGGLDLRQLTRHSKCQPPPSHKNTGLKTSMERISEMRLASHGFNKDKEIIRLFAPYLDIEIPSITYKIKTLRTTSKTD